MSSTVTSSTRFLMMFKAKLPVRVVYGIVIRKSAMPFLLAADVVGNPRDDRQHDRSEDGRHEVGDTESWREPRGQLEHDGVEDDEEEAKRDDCQRQREENEDRLDQRVQQSENQRGDGERNDRTIVKSR